MFWILDRPIDIDMDIIYGTLNIGANTRVWKSERCETCQRTRTVKQINDLILDLYGTALLDFVWIDDAQIIVTETLTKLIGKYNITGVNLRRVKISSWYKLNTNNNEIEDILRYEKAPILFQIEVASVVGNLWHEDGLQSQNICSACGVSKIKPPQKIALNQANWDGSDFFVTKEFPNIYFISDKFSRILRENQIKNYRLINPENRL